MVECSQEFTAMLAKYKSDVHHECLLIDDFLADTGPILQYVAELEAAKRSLVSQGYTYHGGEMWKPPLGKVPRFLSMTGGMP